jgi:hypothetical protein
MKLDQILQLPDSTIAPFLTKIGLSPREFRLNAHFSRIQTEKFLDIWNNPSIRMMHFTKHQNLINIAKEKSIWLNNSRNTNDKFEMKYGMKALEQLLSTETSDRLWSVFDDFHTGVSDKIKNYIEGHKGSFIDSTYIFCLSQKHDDAPNGTFNMYRSYDAELAVEINPKPMGMVSSALGANTYPVIYKPENKLLDMINEIANRIIKYPEILEGLSEEEIIGYMWCVIEQTVYGTKDPYFSAEAEWRIVYTPALRDNSKMVHISQNKTGTDFDAFALPLQDYPEEGVLGLEIPKLVERVILKMSDEAELIRSKILSANTEYNLGLNPSICEIIDLPDC